MPSTVRSLPLIAALLVFSLLTPAHSSESDHTYQLGEPVTLWVNKVGPYNNPQETYNYYSLPFCHSTGHVAHRWGGLGEVLGGNELIDSQLEIKFQRNVDKAIMCELKLDEAKVKQFKDAIEKGYWFEFFIDDLPLWGLVGQRHPDKNGENAKHLLLTHKNIIVKYNNDKIIHVNITQDNAKPLVAGQIIDMTYSVKWIPTDITFPSRFDVYLDHPFFEHQIHWFSIFNSFMMVIFLTGLVSMILMRTLRNDYAKYAREDDDLETLVMVFFITAMTGFLNFLGIILSLTSSSQFVLNLLTTVSLGAMTLLKINKIASARKEVHCWLPKQLQLIL